MTVLSPTDAAFSVFPFSRSHARFVARFVGYSAPVGWIGSVLSELALGPYLAEVARISQAGSTVTPEMVSRLAATIQLPQLLLAMVVSLALSSVLLAMALRKTVLNREEGRFGLALGQLELRLLAGAVLLAVGLTAGSSVILAASALAGAGGVAFGLAGCVLLGVLAIGRFGLWGVLATGRGGLGFAASWQESGRAFWGLVGAYVLWFLAAMVGFLFASLLVSIVTGGQGAMAAAMEAGSVYALTLQGLVAGLLYGALQGFITLGTVCVGAYAWHQIQANTPVAQG